MGYNYTNTKGQKYYLNSKEVQLRNGRQNTIYFFSKDMRRATAANMPKADAKGDWQVKESPRTGLPILSRVK